MTCAVGYPSLPCPYENTSPVTRANCGKCKNFIPPKHILAWCIIWDRDKELCHLPKSACATCQFKNVRGPGRPPGEGVIDWNDPASILKYKAEWRAKNVERVNAAAERFASAHPNYFRNYYERNKETLKEKRKAKNANDT